MAPEPSVKYGNSLTLQHAKRSKCKGQYALILPIARAGYELHAFTEKFPRVQQWLEGEKKPTVKQLEEFSKKVHLPFGYLFLPEPPQERIPIPFFRTNGNLPAGQADQTERISINVYDTILLLQQRSILNENLPKWKIKVPVVISTLLQKSGLASRLPVM